MKNVILCLALLLFASIAMAQSETGKTPAQEATEKLIQQYSLDASQQAEMLKIQERKYRNLAEIEPLKKTAPQQYLLKIRALQHANEKSFEGVLREEQIKIFRQGQISLREKKAQAYKEIKAAGSSQQEIDQKMIELDLEALN